MDIEAVNSTLSRAIIGLQGGEIDAMAEAMATGAISSYDVPAPSGITKGRAGAYKVPSPAEFGFTAKVRKPPKQRKPRARAKSGKLSAAQRKKLIAQIYKELPKGLKWTQKEVEYGYVTARLKDGGRRRMAWTPTLNQAVGRTSKGMVEYDFLDELSDDMLGKLAQYFGIGGGEKPPTAGLKWNRSGDRLLTKVSGEKLLAVLRELMTNQSGAEINGVLLDGSTISLIVRIADKLNPANRKKFLGLPVGQMGHLAWEMAS